MAAAQYIGVGNVARKVKGQYFGVGGVARKVKNGYVGAAGVARRFYAGLDIKPTLADNDWATIAAVSEMGAASTYWSVGDEKDITLSSGETLTLAIMGFDHDDLASGGKAGITFGMKDLISGLTCEMNKSGYNTGGFAGSDMYTKLQNTLLPTLPADLQSVIKNVNKKTSAGAESATINTNAMKLFLFAEIEVTGSRTYSYAGEGAQYSYFATGTSWIKHLHGSTSTKAWWLRSPCIGWTTRYAFMSYAGNVGSNGAQYTDFICFGFCV